MIKRAVIVDDDIEIQMVSSHLLKKREYEVATASGLGDLVCHPELLEADLMLLDYDLGDFNGLDVIDYLSNLRLDMAIILISSCDPEMASHILKEGARKRLNILGFLPKSKLLTELDHFIGLPHNMARQVTASDLALAMQSGHLFTAYQPKYDLASRKITGVEVLARWKDPVLGIIPPDCFIPLAEQSGQIVDLTWYVIKRAFAQQERWRRNGSELNIAINIPAQLLKVPNLLDTFDRMVASRAKGLEGVTLELTENTGIECYRYARHILQALRERGCRLSLDDFGTGHSSLTQLHQLPFDELKLDRSYVSHCDEEHDATAITLSAIELAKRLGLKVVAEGIETPGQLERLRLAGCDEGQGYLWAPAMPEAEFNAWLSNQSIEQRPLAVKANAVTTALGGQR
ncbi:EAL domain, c-di-GMP-specific phosphodiesterase class I (or its enzymatically inactive variant) [Onishia taeanensis]|uniref:EAL domain, c-di-GMP-specific phosphodiesterase class I (Or its enzymatically inactive variant) n=1 Tax=Onishia taeanensis TaxID=284577 RepID=A0A1G7SBN2_9GAMM|nr:EAL domain-containing response regulator [Halomonas taeanensis]SDG20428.1 EAL domain, c-di-GMP-specific phosphodiesterase class I (or its enzymatically inactive variant) [Halomonas taeanensis]